MSQSALLNQREKQLIPLEQAWSDSGQETLQWEETLDRPLL